MRHCTCIATLNLATTLLLMAPAISRADTVYVTAGAWMGDIFQIVPDGTRTVFVGFHTYSSEGVSGIAVDGSGNVYAASYYGNTITRYSPTGVGTSFANTGIAYPQGITFDSAGNLTAVGAVSSVPHCGTVHVIWSCVAELWTLGSIALL